MFQDTSSWLHPVLVLFALVFQCTISNASTILVEPNGTYTVSLNTAELVDHNRIDPYSSNNASRAVMMSLFLPIDRNECQETSAIDAWPRRTAALFDTIAGISNGTFESVQLQVCSDPGLNRSLEKVPLVLFSHGLGASRFLYNAIAQTVASSGFAVVTIDHPYDAAIVELADGRVIYAANITTDAEIDQSVSVRRDDASFVLSQLGNSSVVQKFIPGARSAFNTRKAAFFGHSLGGATAVAALEKDKRFVGGMDLDGSLHLINNTIHQPVLIMGREDHNRSNDNSWLDAWNKFKGWKREFDVWGTQHNTYTDGPILLKLAGLPLPPEVGTIDGARSFNIITTLVSAFAGFVLNGSGGELLNAPNATFPEVHVY